MVTDNLMFLKEACDYSLYLSNYLGKKGKKYKKHKKRIKKIIKAIEKGEMYKYMKDEDDDL